MPYDQGLADFSETAYGMYLTFEIQQWLKEQGDLDGIAIPPNLREEADLGFDAAIPRRWGILYLQFKMPQFLRRSNASEFATFAEPYFRFRVKTDVTTNGKVQHNVLCDLENSGESVFYAAPCFLTRGELERFALNDGMYLNSVFPRPGRLGPVNPGSRHSFAYTGIHDVRPCSDPGPKFSGSFEFLGSSLTKKVRESEPLPLDRFLSKSLDSLTSHIEPIDFRDGSIVQRLTLLSNSVGLQPVLVVQ